EAGAEWHPRWLLTWTLHARGLHRDARRGRGGPPVPLRRPPAATAPRDSGAALGSRGAGVAGAARPRPRARADGPARGGAVSARGLGCAWPGARAASRQALARRAAGRPRPAGWGPVV